MRAAKLDQLRHDIEDGLESGPAGALGCRKGQTGGRQKACGADKRQPRVINAAHSHTARAPSILRTFGILSPRAAKHRPNLFLDKLDQIFNSLAGNPHIGRAREELNTNRLRT